LKLIALEYKLIVRPSDIDMLGHVNNAVYALYLEDAKIVAFKENPERFSLGAPNKRTVELYVEYNAPAFQHDKLSMFVWQENGDSLCFHLCKDDKILLKAREKVQDLAKL